MKKITINDILKKKNKGKVTVLTCYDYSFAKILDEAGIDIILVGDSLANVVLGMQDIKNISLLEMVNHTEAVAGGVNRSLVVADMPYKAYQKDPKKSLYYAKKFIKAGADAVKIEWFSKVEFAIKRLIKNKIPVMGHIGLTPQTAHLFGGYKVQGRDEPRAKQLIEQAKILQELGVFSIVLECIPYQLARRITKALKIPTIGIGAGKYCDGQVLVLYDFLGLYKEKKLKFIRLYCDLSSQIKGVTSKYIQDVRMGRFPSKNESFSLKREK
jgi:3-methyl-2-oxobutanoate hydroxymethyltransferase